MISRAESIANTITMTGREYDEICKAHEQAGYRAAMAAVRRTMAQLTEEDHNEGCERDWWKLSRWLDEQVKKEEA